MNDIASIRKTRPWPPSLLSAGGALALAAGLGGASLTVLDFALRGKQISLASGTVSLPRSAGGRNNPVHAQVFHDLPVVVGGVPHRHVLYSQARVGAAVTAGTRVEHVLGSGLADHALHCGKRVAQVLHDFCLGS